MDTSTIKRVSTNKRVLDLSGRNPGPATKVLDLSGRNLEPRTKVLDLSGRNLEPRTKVLDLSGRDLSPVRSTKRRKKKVRFDEPRKDFQLIRSLSLEEAAVLDKLRDDLQESIERTVRVQQAFVKELTKNRRFSNRIKHIIDSVEVIPFHSNSQLKVISDHVYDILKSKNDQAERKCSSCQK